VTSVRRELNIMNNRPKVEVAWNSAPRDVCEDCLPSSSIESSSVLRRECDPGNVLAEFEAKSERLVAKDLDVNFYLYNR